MKLVAMKEAVLSWAHPGHVVCPGTYSLAVGQLEGDKRGQPGSHTAERQRPRCVCVCVYECGINLRVCCPRSMVGCHGVMLEGVPDTVLQTKALQV